MRWSLLAVPPAQTGAGPRRRLEFPWANGGARNGQERGRDGGSICRDSRPIQEAEGMRVWCARSGTCVASDNHCANVFLFLACLPCSSALLAVEVPV